MANGVLVLTATDKEQADLFKWLACDAVTLRFGRRWAEGKYHGRPIRLIETGVGAVNTAHALTVALETVLPTFVLQFGIGGAYTSSGLSVGDLAIATEECYGDLGVLTPDGWCGMDFIGFPVIASDPPCFNRFPLNAELIKAAVRCLSTIEWEGPPPRIGTGPFVTVNQCSGVQAVGDAVAARFNGLCENMEGAPAAHVCALYGVPFVELRCFSNRVEDRNFSAWNIPLAMHRAQLAAKAVLEALGHSTLV